MPSNLVERSCLDHSQTVSELRPDNLHLRHQASIPSLGLPRVSPEQPRRGPRGQRAGPGARPYSGEGGVKNAPKLMLALETQSQALVSCSPLWYSPSPLL